MIREDYNHISETEQSLGSICSYTDTSNMRCETTFMHKIFNNYSVILKP